MVQRLRANLVHWADGSTMGFFYSVRGWLEGNDEHVVQLKRIVWENVDGNPHPESWCFQVFGGGFSRFVFFGCTVRDVALPAVRAQVARIAQMVSSRDGDDIDFLEGRFDVTAEDESVRLTWELCGGHFRETTGSFRESAGEFGDWVR